MNQISAPTIRTVIEASQPKESVLRAFRQIPGVGKTIAVDLWNLGLRSIEDLRGNDPESLYAQHCAIQGMKVDRCMLYVMRCAVYYASTSPEQHDPKLLKWWNWTDEKMPII